MNVCIFRIPEGSSIVAPPSACMSCGNRLKPYHNIPVFSYMVLGGKCAFCGTKISMQYPLVELANGLLYVLAVYLFGPTPAALGAMLAVSVFFVGMMISFARSSIPVSVAFFAFLLSLPVGIYCFGHGYPEIIMGLAGGALLALLPGLATKQGDIYSLVLFGGAAGAMTGPYGAAGVAVVAAALWAAAAGIGAATGYWNTRRMMSGFICIAGAVMVYIGDGWITGPLLGRL
jgi:leader peptidase (prepilin peptidase)/N-methyltransferase